MTSSKPILHCSQIGGGYVVLDRDQEIVLWFLPNPEGGDEKAIAMYRNSCLTTVEDFKTREDAIARAKDQIRTDMDEKIYFHIGAAQEAQGIRESLE